MSLRSRFGGVVLSAVLALGYLLVPITSASAEEGETFTVNTAGDDPIHGDICSPLICTLRGAINQANRTPVIDTIRFDIGSGPQTIALRSGPNDLRVTRPIIIDGTTQPGYEELGSRPLIELDGRNDELRGLSLAENADGSIIRGLAIGGFWFRGIELDSDRTLIEHNYIGVDDGGSSANGNHLGVDVSGSGNVLRQNVISGNHDGVWISSGGNALEGNLVGTDASGQKAIANVATGVSVGGSGNVVAGNVISATGSGTNSPDHEEAGLMLSGDSNRVLRNFIGTDITGTRDLGNADSGIRIIGNADGNVIGGRGVGSGNTIAYNDGDGINVVRDYFGDIGTSNAILGNAIFSNAQLGIDLEDNGPTPNDVGDVDEGANRLQNAPVLASRGASTVVHGELESAPDARYTIDVFSNDECDASGFGEGRYFLGSVEVTTDASGRARFKIMVRDGFAGSYLSAVAHDDNGNTSEFSNCR